MNDNKVMNRATDNIRILAASMVEKAKSGHPGGAMGGNDFLSTHRTVNSWCTIRRIPHGTHVTASFLTLATCRPCFIRHLPYLGDTPLRN